MWPIFHPHQLLEASRTRMALAAVRRRVMVGLRHAKPSMNASGILSAGRKISDPVCVLIE